MKKFQLEMGGKNPLVVLDDADLKVAVEARSTAPSSRPASAAPPRRA
jgi:acyl-CoA reductase-like NAD-dependent aldehyde dehydrogenase